jgi:hypothetical protein
MFANNVRLSIPAIRITWLIECESLISNSDVVQDMQDIDNKAIGVRLCKKQLDLFWQIFNVLIKKEKFTFNMARIRSTSISRVHSPNVHNFLREKKSSSIFGRTATRVVMSYLFFRKNRPFASASLPSDVFHVHRAVACPSFWIRYQNCGERVADHGEAMCNFPVSDN